MKKKANFLNTTITDEMKSKPYWMTSELWADLKQVISEFRSLLVDEFLSAVRLRDIYCFIDIGLEGIAKDYAPDIVYDAHKHFYDLVEHYLNMAVKYELYETAQNIIQVQNKFLVKVKK